MNQNLKGSVLSDNVLAVLDAVEEGVEVADGGDEAVRTVGGVVVVVAGGSDGEDVSPSPSQSGGEIDLGRV